MFNIKGSWCTRRWQTCFFSPNSVCFRNCGCLWQRDAAASRGNDVTYQPISVSKLTFKSTRGPQLSTLRGGWRSNYYSENHVTHTSIMIGQQDWWPWQLPLSDSPKRTRGGGRRWGTIPQSDACFPGGWERSRGRKAEGACLESFQESLQFHQSSLFICCIVTSSSLCRSRFYSLSSNETQKWTPFVLETCTQHVVIHWTSFLTVWLRIITKDNRTNANLNAPAKLILR